MKTSQPITRKAFTMLELVFVIVVVGILSYFAASGFQRNTAVEAADQIVSHIRYTQHLAMQDDKFDSTDATYYRERWQIRFTTDSSGTGHEVYWIMSDRDHNGLLTDLSDYAKDPLDGTKYLSGDTTLGNNRSPALDLTAKYGINGIVYGCGQRIFFDNLGRPYNDTTYPATAPNQNLITAICTIFITNGTQSRTIEISPETGYVRHYLLYLAI
jgi:prepilin-type N-terminal cleavage/methylation domain-containing protein